MRKPIQKTAAMLAITAVPGTIMVLSFSLPRTAHAVRVQERMEAELRKQAANLENVSRTGRTTRG
ncbi:MAG: hypothetical protein ACJ70Z_03275 [Nitrososphaera sp.]